MIGCYLLNASRAAELPHLWQPAQDDVFLQEIGSKIESRDPLQAVAALGDEVFVGTTNGIAKVDHDRLTDVTDVREPIARLVSTGGTLWALGPHGLFRLRNGAWRKVTSQPVTDLTSHNGEVVAVIGRRLFRIQSDSLLPLT
jgi:hypothetical protein